MKTVSIPQKLNDKVTSVIGQKNVIGFEKAYLIATATKELKQLLTPEYMSPIMELQGSRLGFKTDKDTAGGYPELQVKNCLIEAVLTGVQPFGNQFNIIAGNTYITKEGFGYLLSNYEGLSYEIIAMLPRINATSTSAAITMKIVWSISGLEKKEREIEIPIRMNSRMGTDAIIGKATRKARAWLHSTISGSEISDGDIQDLDSKSYEAKTINVEALNISEEFLRVKKYVADAKTQKQLRDLEDTLIAEESLTEDIQSLLETRKTELS